MIALTHGERCYATTAPAPAATLAPPMPAAVPHAVGHAARMAARRARNRISCRRSVRGPAHEIVTAGAVLRNVSIHVRGGSNRIVIAPQARVSNVDIRMAGTGHALLIGSHVSMHAGSIEFYDDGCRVSIGERTTIFGASIGVTEGGSIAVGEDCLLSSEVDLRNGDSHSIVDADTGARLNPAADVTIDDHVWLGKRVMVLKGGRIGAHTVVGAGSIVNGELPAHSIAAGSPARAIAGGVTWLRERI
jgi:acetyltransferase-like isoleucine patch superfamily enzyme